MDVRRRVFLTIAGIVLLAGIAIALLAFPTRSGCLGGEGAISSDIPLYLCSTPHSLLTKGVETPGLASRVSVIGIAVVVASMLAWAAFEDTLPQGLDLVPRRPDGPAGSGPVRWKR